MAYLNVDELSWGKLLDKWHDEGRVFHLLKADGSPACGANYYSSTGTYPDSHAPFEPRCGNCNKIAAARLPKS